jgi:hypothetical protein
MHALESPWIWRPNVAGTSLNCPGAWPSWDFENEFPPGWISGIAIAAIFALCHLPKAGITRLQIGVIFVMGVVHA